MMFEIKRADELVSPELEARWASRRAAREDAVFAAVIRAFVETGGPVSADDIARRPTQTSISSPPAGPVGPMSSASGSSQSWQRARIPTRRPSIGARPRASMAQQA